MRVRLANSEDLGQGDLMNDDDRGLGLHPGDKHYRAYVGHPSRYDVLTGQQFGLLTSYGLREHHRVCDIGCGSLRLGRVLMPFLLPGNYFGIEPNEWLIQEGVEKECGEDLVRIKRPVFYHGEDFQVSRFRVTFEFVIAHSIFTHATMGQIRQCLREVSACLSSGGQFFATFQPAEHDHLGEAWHYPSCCGYRYETIRALAKESDLTCDQVEWPHPEFQEWLRLTHPESAARRRVEN